MATQTSSRSTTESSRQENQPNQSQTQRGTTGLARQGNQGSPSLWRQPEGFFALNPFSLMRRLQEDMDQLLGNVANTAAQTGTGTATLWVPPIEVSEQEGKLVISAEVPGVNDEDIEIEVANDALVLHGVKQQERREGEGGTQRTERFYGEFYRAIPLPEGANPDQATARFQDGVLKIEVPLQQSSRKRIPVQSSSTTQGKGSAEGEKRAA